MSYDGVRHIYIGMSKKVWCGAKIERNRDGSLRGPAPITEGEFLDGFGQEYLCPACHTACASVRGEPGG